MPQNIHKTMNAISVPYESFSLNRNYSMVIYLNLKNIAGQIKKKAQF